MAETIIKISSNPYTRDISFFELRDGRPEISVEAATPDSRLITPEIKGAFLPFKAEKIIDIIVSDYRSPDSVEPTQVVFEGPSDEYRDLEDVCSGRDDVVLSKGNRVLENARFIRNDIVSIFDSIEPVVAGKLSNNESIRENIIKFRDATRETVPICVIGNYSAGKSAFINALIGYELLASDEKPTTGRIFKIRRSKFPDHGTISFNLDGSSVRLTFGPSGLESASDDEGHAVETFKPNLAETPAEPIPQMRAILKEINCWKGDDKISDAIEVEAPFSPMSQWALSRDFVIFDTPGSNSATFSKHAEVLEAEMERMSNGILVFVGKNDALDSNDGLDLCNKVKEFKAIDSRLSLLVVNRADEADLREESFRKSDVLGQIVPATMDPQGVYYVASIFALGAKTGGKLSNPHYAKIYRNVDDFRDPESEFYQQLYKFDILPGNIEKKVMTANERCTDLILKNSGIFSVEYALQQFAEKYSEYNKCDQASRFLSEIVKEANCELLNKSMAFEQLRDSCKEEYGEKEQEFIKSLNDKTDELEKAAHDGYPEIMKRAVEEACTPVTAETIQSRESDLITEEQCQNGLEDLSDKFSKACDSLRDNFGNNTRGMFEAPSLDRFRAIFSSAAGDMKTTIDLAKERESARRASVETAGDRALEEIDEMLASAAASGRETLVARSRGYWSQQTENCKKKLTALVTESSELDPRKREQLTRVIASYLDFSVPASFDGLFDREKMHGIWLGELSLLDTERLNAFKVANTYNNALRKYIAEEACPEIESSHKKSFDYWLSQLKTLLRENLVELSPTLAKKNEEIKHFEAEISDLKQTMELLKAKKEQVESLKSWKKRSEG